MSLTGAIADIQAKALSVEGINAAPPEPTESANVFPFAVTYEARGEIVEMMSGAGYDNATLVCEIHVARQLLPQAIRTAMSLRDPFIRKLLQDPKLGGEVSTVRGIRRQFGRLEWGTLQTIGYRFEIDVKVQL